jgi:hypothetical protein
MNNKKVLKKYPEAVAVEYKTQFDTGFVGKGVSFFIIQEGNNPEYALGFGRTEKDAWRMATTWLGNDMSVFKDYKGYPIENAKLEME